MNFNTPALLFGLILLVASIALFVFGRLKPEIQRDSDSVYAIIGMVCALILFGSAFDLSLGMSFQQLLMIGALIALMWENIQARQPKNVGARRGMLDGVWGWGSGRDMSRRGAPMVDDDRPVSRVYRAELEDLTLLEDQRTSRRIRGGQDSRDDDWEGSRRTTRRNEYAGDVPRRPRGSLNGSPIVDNEEDRRPRLRAARSLPLDRSAERPLAGDRPGNTPSWDEDEKPVRRPRQNSADGASRPSESSVRPSSERSNSARTNSSRVERVRPPSSQRRKSEPSSDYVDYQPIDRPESGGARDYE
ncbi:MAG: Ycf66 family protein [Timaviella obliquedivisa GSE-PSE-MK23-08B]|nr:Ycf66 family protein [Timaviella obliquedivisa GSE-PSE-MK23-08B]